MTASANASSSSRRGCSRRLETSTRDWEGCCSDLYRPKKKEAKSPRPTSQYIQRGAVLGWGSLPSLGSAWIAEGGRSDI